jgi:hypothetical protein
VKHLDSGELRRMMDEPDAFGDDARTHASTCAECAARADGVRADAQHAAGVLAGEPTVDASRAYAAIRERVATPSVGARWYPLLTGAALAAVFVAALLLTPLGTYARSFLTIFQPQQFEPIRVSRADLQNLRLLPQANDVGVQRVVLKPKRSPYASIASAQQHASFTLLKPSVLPHGFGTVHSFFVSSPGEMTFTFSAAKARAFEKRSHKALPPMPAGLDGTTVRLQTGQIFHGHYEATPPAGKRAARTASFELVEMRAPRVTSTGVSLNTLERYLLSMPNVSPDLASQIRALGDVESTLPVPVMIDKQTARSVSVHGSGGLAIGDNTGLGAGVVWQKNGIIYVVAGPLSMDEVTSIADGLR